LVEAVEKNSCGRSMLFAACWFAAPAARNFFVDSGFRRIFSERQKALRCFAKR